MTHPDNGRNIGLLLDAAVPDLPAPPDRLPAVGGRVRRQRIRLTVLTATCVTLVLVGAPLLVTGGAGHPVDAPAMPASPQRPDAGDCPAGPPTFFQDDGTPQSTAPGLLVPAGAVRAVMCQYDSVWDWRKQPSDSPSGTMMLTVSAGPPRELTLTRDVAGLVAALNKLPLRSGPDPCFAATPGGYLTLVYENGTTARVEFGGCDVARRGDVVRHDSAAGEGAFDDRFLQQELAAARPDTVTPADCAPGLQPAPVGYAPDRFFTPDPVNDVWLHATSRFLPIPAAVVTACRYVRGGDGSFGRTGQVSDRGLAGQVADALNTSYQTNAFELPFDNCTTGTTVRTVDALIVRDVVGETAEARIVRDSCNVVTFGFSGAKPNAGLLTLLDRLLGPLK